MALSLRESIAKHRKIVRDDRIIESRAAFLSPDDRNLLKAVWIEGMRTQQLASLARMSPSKVRHRVNRLVRHIHSHEFLAAVRSLGRLEGPQAELARLHFCQGLSLRDTAEAIGMTYHQARLMAAEVRGVLLSQWASPEREEA